MYLGEASVCSILEQKPCTVSISCFSLVSWRYASVCFLEGFEFCVVPTELVRLENIFLL